MQETEKPLTAEEKKQNFDYNFPYCLPMWADFYTHLDTYKRLRENLWYLLKCEPESYGDAIALVVEAREAFELHAKIQPDFDQVYKDCARKLKAIQREYELQKLYTKQKEHHEN